MEEELLDFGMMISLSLYHFRMRFSRLALKGGIWISGPAVHLPEPFRRCAVPQQLAGVQGVQNVLHLFPQLTDPVLFVHVADA